MPNPWESSSSKPKSTLNSAAASVMPTARLSDVVLCLSHPMGKRDFTTYLRSALRVSMVIGEAGLGRNTAADRSASPPSPRTGSWRASTAWRKIEQRQYGAILCSSSHASKRGARWTNNSAVWECPELSITQPCPMQNSTCKQLISRKLCEAFDLRTLTTPTPPSARLNNDDADDIRAYSEVLPGATLLLAKFKARCRWSSILGRVRWANSLRPGSAPFWISYRKSAALPFW
jgi:hypothetical protein